MVGNLFWGMQFAPFSHKTALDERSSSISLVSRKNGAKPHRHYFDCRFVQGTNLTKKSNQKSLLKFLLLFAFAKSRVSLLSRHCEANRRFAEAIQNKNNPCDSTPNLARFVVQKIGFKDAVVPSADFLLESDKRGSPPKSEKRQLLARRGSGVGGAALLRKETSESQSKKIVSDSQVATMDCHESLRDSRNDRKKTNFANQTQKNNRRDCGGGFVFVRIFGIETRLGVCEIPKILTSAKDAPKSELTYNDSIYLRITRDSTQITRKSTAFKANLI